ncbi:MAG: DPP IV N-terminal domain-containing protein [Verrucomicrobiota bacterium]
MRIREWQGTSRLRWSVLAAVAGLVISLGAGGAQAAGGADSSFGRGGKKAASAGNASLSFVRTDRGDESSIYLLSPDGRHASRVLPGKGPGERLEEPAYYFDPAWSRDGRLLAFTVETVPFGSHGYDDIYVLTPQKKLDPIPGGDSSFSGSPSWAPDGKRLVLVGYQYENGGGLYVARRGAKTNSELTPEFGDSADDTPAWSPDGKTIAFARAGSGQTGLYLMRPDGAGLRQITKTKAQNPSWAPDCRRLVFDISDRIAVIDAGGSHFRFLTTPGKHDSDPAWSPDGRTIAFVRGNNIWAMSSTGRNQKLLVRNAKQPAWKRG